MSLRYNENLTSPFEERLAEIEHSAAIAVSNGAQILSFQEFTIVINEEDRETFIAKCQEIVRENDVYVSMTYAYFAKKLEDYWG